MDIRKSIDELDILYKKRLYPEVEGFLLSQIKEAKEENDRTSELTLLNELIGYYRTSSRYRELIITCNSAINLLNELDLDGTIPYATTILNVATAYRESGRVEESLDYFKEVLRIYRASLSKYDMRLASLYNNMSIAYVKMKNYDESFSLLEDALTIVVNNKGTVTEEAVTYSNMAKSLLKMNKFSEAIGYVEKSLTIFENNSSPKSFHYAASLSDMGELQFIQENYEDALKYYTKALDEIENTVGRNSYYAATLRNISSVYERMNMEEQKNKYKSMADQVSNSLRGGQSYEGS